MSTVNTFTFPDSGFSLEYRKLSFLLLSEMRSNYIEKHPTPKPPMIEIKGEPGEENLQEPNFSDPNYTAQLAEWSQNINHAVELIARVLYVKIAIVSEADEEQVKMMVDSMAAMGVNLTEQLIKEYKKSDVPLPGDIITKYIYVWYVCVTTMADYLALVDAITQQSQPTPKAVEKAVEMFQSQASRN